MLLSFKLKLALMTRFSAAGSALPDLLNPHSSPWSYTWFPMVINSLSPHAQIEAFGETEYLVPTFLLIAVVIQHLGSNLSKKALVTDIPKFAKKYVQNGTL